MQFEGDLRKQETKTPFNNNLTGGGSISSPSWTQNTPTSKHVDPFIGVTPLGTPIVYNGSNPQLKNSDANEKAKIALRAMNKGLTGETSVKLNTQTGNIKLSAPKKILESEAGKKIVSNDTLLSLSQAYKLNPDYKVTYTDIDENGKEVTNNITIPEYVDKISNALENLAQNTRTADSIRYYYVKEFGDKAENLNDEQIRMSIDYDGDTIPVPDFLFSGRNPMRDAKQYVANGRIKKEDLKKYYNRDNLDREDMAAMYGRLRVNLDNADWNKDTYYTDDEGNEIYDRGSAEEMAKAIAFRNYILKNDPDSSWLQSVGDNIASAFTGAVYGFDRVFLNIANVGQAIFTLGQGQEVQNYIKDADKAFGQFQQDEQLLNDSAATAAYLGQIGGTIAGTIAEAWLTGKVTGGIGKAASKIGGSALESAAEAVGAAKGVSSAAEMLELAKNADNISKGTLFVLHAMNGVQKAQLVANVAKAFLANHKTLNFVTDFLMDTVHDTLLYDSTTLRDALQSSDQETRDYWLGQLADNAKWWGGMAGAKSLIKWSGKTPLGQALNVQLTKLNAKIAGAAGGKWAQFKDTMAGGSTIKKLEDQLAKAKADGNIRKANRIQNKINQTNWNTALRNSEKQLGSLKLEWEGGKLTEKSAEKYNDLMTRVKALNNGIDSYTRNISFKRQEMIGRVRDPATGKINFINPDLGGANEKATKLYIKVSELEAKHGMTPAPDSLVSQASVDYMMSQYHLSLAKSFSEAGGEMAEDATKAIPILEKNLELAKAELPDDVVNAIDKGLSQKSYQSFYAQLNEYGRSKGLLNVDKTKSYEANPIWAENGYMPIAVEHPKTGHWESDSGRIDAVIDQDFNKMTFRVAEGQHYVDPEIVRQTRINTMARAEVNRDLFKAYSGFGSDARNVTRVSGEQTEYVRKINENKKTLEAAVNKQASAFAENFEAELQKVRRSKPTKNVQVKQSYVNTAISGLSISDTSQLLLDKKVLKTRDQKLTDGVTRANYDEWYGKQNKKVQNYLKQQYNNMAGDGQVGFDALQTAMRNGGEDFEAGLQRAYLMGDKEFARSSVMNEAMRNIQDGKDAFYEGVVKARAKANLHNVTTIKTGQLVDDLHLSINKSINTYVGGVTDNAGAKAIIGTMAEDVNGADEVGRYIALRQLSDSPKAKELAYASIDKEVDDMVKGKNVSTDDAALIKKQAHEMFDSELAKELDDASNSARTINPDLIGPEGIFDKAQKLNDDIMGAEKSISVNDGSGTVMYLDAQGRQVYAQVDPAFASLYNYRYKMTKVDAGTFAKANAAMSKLFRYGTTSVNLSSFGNQMFRDFGNAVLVGGAWQTIKSNANNLVDVFGKNIVEQIKAFDPSGYELRQVKQLAKSSGTSVEQAAVSRELMKGAAISPTTTERTLYKDFMKQAYGGSTDDVILNMKSRFQEIVDKYNPEELLNGKRENYLRNRVYASSLNDAMKSGYTVEQARVYAEFAMNNATTNFSRQLYHMQAIADSTPYFRAAINGTKSFWRMWTLDPVGISGRIMGGLILPTIYLTGASLSNKEDKEIYKNIPEYQKTNSMVFVHNGQVISVPIPQELGNIVAPFRQFVEYLNDANTNDFWELMQNDVLGLSPIDLTAFTTVDMDHMISDPTLLDRIGRGTSRVFSQMAPIPIKSAYMLATGIDPYTGKRLSDPSYSYWNEETGSVETMDYNQNAFAKWFASLFGDNMSPYLAEKIVSGIIGTTGINVLGDLTSLLQEGPEGWLDSVGSNVTGSLAKPFYIDTYDLTDSVWKRAVRELTAEKNGITASDEYKTVLKEMAQEKDPEKRKKLSASLQDIVNKYQQKVVDTVKRLGTEYSGTFDRKKFAATLQLLNFNTDPVYQSAVQATSDDASSTFFNGRDAAIATMRALGVKGTEDISIFGYGAVDRDGNIVIKYSNPVAIMDAQNVWNSQKDIHLANIKATVQEAGLWDAKDAMKNQVNAIYGKGKLKNSDYDKINNIYIDWNAKVMSTIAPYVAEMTPEAAINNSSVMDYLDGLIEVPSEYKKDRYGRYVTNKKLGEGSAKDAYIKSYIKNIFKINDTGYAGGKNYSGRK